MKTLVIIDGKSIFYRGYYAMGNLSMHDGTPTSGIYGFAAIAMQIVRQINPDKVVVAWDSKNSTSKRRAIFADYKAGRVKPKEDFYAQIPLLKELIKTLGWEFFECDNYEADDIIGTLAAQAEKDGNYQTYIISSDLDMLQVLDKNTKMYRVLQGFSKLEEIDTAVIEKKYGIKKNQFLDFKALKGDSSDNIPGVAGIGEKSAAKLLNDYQTLDGVYEHIDEISGSTRDKLASGKDKAYMSLELAKIMTDAPVNLNDIPELKINEPDLVKMLKKLEFNSIIKRFGLKDDAPAEKKVTPAPEISDDIVISWDVKSLMHDDEKVAEQILKGKTFWDLGQGDFLLDPLKRSLEEGDVAENYAKQKQSFKDYPKLYMIFIDFDLPMIPILYKMEKQGVLIDKDYFASLRSEFEDEVKKQEKVIWDLAGEEFNVNSPMQLADILYVKLGLPTKGIKKNNRGFSTGAKELDKIKDLHPIVEKIITYRENAKLLNSYIIPIPELADKDTRVHTTFTQNVTATGRLSSLSPNLQNIPVRTEEGKRLRKGFIAAPGKILVSADYSQFELRLAAALSNDQKLIDDFNSGVDIHTKTAAEVFGVALDQVEKKQRRAAKIINFGVLYGMSAKTLAEATGMEIKEAKQFIDDYFELRKPMREYLDNILKQAREKGYVETLYGRRRPTPDVKSSNFLVRNAAERAAQNMPVQGTEADLMKRAMIMLDQKLPKGADLIMQVHDSLIVECDEKLATEVADLLKTTMENVAPELKVKLSVDVSTGKNWGEI